VRQPSTEDAPGASWTRIVQVDDEFGERQPLGHRFIDVSLDNPVLLAHERRGGLEVLAFRNRLPISCPKQGVHMEDWQCGSRGDLACKHRLASAAYANNRNPFER
jgi:hypothetical protein